MKQNYSLEAVLFVEHFHYDTRVKALVVMRGAEDFDVEFLGLTRGDSDVLKNTIVEIAKNTPEKYWEYRLTHDN